MATFPRTESEVVILAESLVAGFTANAVTYPAPPITILNLNSLKTDFIAAQNDLIAAQASAEQATAAKREVFDVLVEAMKSNIRYAENTVNFDDDKLKLIGWAGRKEKTALAVPGQPRLLEAPKQGEGWVFLDWKAPADGGKPNAYKVMRRERPEGAWQEVATAIDSEATLVEQPRGKELEYRIVAINKSGESEPSNTVMVVL
ncbi:MAG: fibronectin type III domain-containing protein [Phycisphaerales bacterium]